MRSPSYKLIKEMSALREGTEERGGWRRERGEERGGEDERGEGEGEGRERGGGRGGEERGKSGEQSERRSIFVRYRHIQNVFCSNRIPFSVIFRVEFFYSRQLGKQPQEILLYRFC